MVLHFLIRGRVQGVGFRWFVHREAAELGLRGWVRNNDDGEVEVLAAGDTETTRRAAHRVATRVHAEAASTPSLSTSSRNRKTKIWKRFKFREPGSAHPASS